MLTRVQSGAGVDALPPLVTDERAARQALRDQIAKLERELCDAVIAAFPHVSSPPVPVAAVSGPRLLGLAELETERDALAGRLREVRAAEERRGRVEEANRVLLERMFLEPRKHKWARLHRAEVGMGGCGAYQVRPRLGVIGMLAGWWHVKLSSGCPLAT
jgi:hypothetical protein